MKMLTIAALGGAAAVVALSGCATTNGTRSGDMTIPEHEQAAAAELKKAYDLERGNAPVGVGLSYKAPSRHRQLASEHAAAAQQRQAEVAAACDGVKPSVTFASMAVERIEPIREGSVPTGLRNPRGYYPEYLKGARIAFSASQDTVPSATQRSLQCEAARASAGLDPANAQSPLAVRTAKLTVVPADSKLVVEIWSPDSADAAEILRRAEAMATCPTR